MVWLTPDNLRAMGTTLTGKPVQAPTVNAPSQLSPAQPETSSQEEVVRDCLRVVTPSETNAALMWCGARYILDIAEAEAALGDRRDAAAYCLKENGYLETRDQNARQLLVYYCTNELGIGKANKQPRK